MTKLHDGLGLFIEHDDEDGDIAVWLGLPGHTSKDDPYTFIIGMGDTRDKAVAEAVRALEEALERLQGPIGVVEEHRYI